MLERIVKTIPIIVAAMIAGSVSAGSTWKPESIVETKHQKVREEISSEQIMKYALSADVEENILTIHVTKNVYNVQYDVMQPIQVVRQQEYTERRSKGAVWGSGTLITTGVGLAVAGVITRLSTNTFSEYNPEAMCGSYPVWIYDYMNDAEISGEYYTDMNDWNSCYEDYVQKLNTETTFLITGAATAAIGFTIPLASKKKQRPTQNYQTVELPVDTLQKTQKGLVLNATIPGRSVPLIFSSQYFTADGQQYVSRDNGNLTVYLDAVDPNFAFSLGDVVNTNVAQQLRNAGYNDSQFIRAMQETALPISYEVTVKTNANEGENGEIKIPVRGYTIDQRALEKTVMGL